MTNTWFTADPHFGHHGVCKFLRNDGTKLRPFDTPEEMDEVLIANWNRVVGEKDRIYVLGDLAMKARAMHAVMPRLKGRKVLIKGNHDIFKPKEYMAYFDDIRACHVLSGMILTHIPIHPSSMARFGTNIHGHLHANRVLLPDDTLDVRYHCVSVEHTGFAPISLEDLKKKIEAEGGRTSFLPYESVYGNGSAD